MVCCLLPRLSKLQIQSDGSSRGREQSDCNSFQGCFWKILVFQSQAILKVFCSTNAGVSATFIPTKTESIQGANAHGYLLITAFAGTLSTA